MKTFKDIIFECGIFHCKSCLLIRLLAKQPHSIGKSIYLFILWMQYEIGYWARTWNCSPELESEQKYLTIHGIFQNQRCPWNHILKSTQQNKKNCKSLPGNFFLESFFKNLIETQKSKYLKRLHDNLFFCLRVWSLGNSIS